jgi:NADPH-dependent 2,4-dienoyl-CoA reductase/sulfur reductase-like enzyme
MTAASTVRRLAPEVEVVVVERGRHTSYSMCGIPYFVGDPDVAADDLVVRSPEQHRDRGIDVRMRTEATAIDPERRTVAVRDLHSGEAAELGYDALLYAVGASPALPPIPGLAEFGHVVHTLDEGEHLKSHLDRWDAEGARRGQHVVVVGGGYIGIELAEALLDRGYDATVIDKAPQVMGTLDADMAAPVEKTLRDRGIRVLLGASLEEVRHVEGPVIEVVCADGSHRAEVLVVATGARPNTAMAEAAGLRLGDSRALAVDDRMRTSAPGIWAAGDAVESRHLVSGRGVNVQLGTHANKQGKVAGADIAAVLDGRDGGDARFPGVVGTAVTRLCNLEVGRTGLIEREAQAAGLDYEAVVFSGSARAGYLPDPGEVLVKLLAERGTGRVLGAQLVGTGNVAKRIDVAATWVQLGVTVQQAQLLDLSYAPPFGGVWDLLQVAAMKMVGQLGLRPAL